MIVKYSINVDKNIPYSEAKLRKFLKKILTDPRGIRILFADKLKLVETNDAAEAKITINLVSNDEVVHKCGFDLLSCADRTNGNIYLNWSRWHEGSDVFFNGLWGKYLDMSHEDKLDLYRTYIVNHEVLHILGFVHPEASERFNGRKASVMAQQTINLHGGKSWWWPERRDKKYFVKYSYNQFNIRQ